MSPEHITILLVKIRSGDLASFSLLHSLTKAHLRRIVARYDRTNSDDILQDVYVSIWLRTKSYDESKNPISWLAAIAKNRAIDYHRARMRNPVILFDQDDAYTTCADPAPNPFEVFCKASGTAQLQRCIDLSLSEKRKTILSMAYEEEMVHTEIAIALQMPLGSVKSEIRRSLFLLRECLNSTCVLSSPKWYN